MRLFLTAALLLGFSGVSVYAIQRHAGQVKLHRVQKIYVGDMGSDDEAARFRLLLQEQLAKKGFTVVDKPESAEALLTGALSVRVLDKGSEARVYVKLDAPDGERLWSKDFGNGIFRNLLTLKEPVKLRAEDVARSLRDDWKKAAKQ